MNKNFLKVTMVALLGMTLGGCDAESLLGDDEEEFSRSTLYLKDSNGAGVAGVSYSCNGGDADGAQLNTAGSTSGTGNMPVNYWPGYDVICNITTNGAPELYLYDANGPITSPAQVSCNNFYGLVGEDGVAGSINNAPSDACNIRLMEVTIN